MFNNNQNYNNGYDTVALQRTVAGTMKRVYVKMTLGLIVTALVSLFCASSTGYLTFLFNNRWFMWALVIAEFALVFGISGAINRMSSAVATALFYLFAAVNGAMLCTIFLAYSPGSIAKTFFITAGTFGAMSVYGYFTKSDLSKMGTYLTMALFGLMIAIVVNLFLKSSAMDWIISIVGVLLFVGLTAWDTQNVKRMAAANLDPQLTDKLATMGAMNLYLDFINLFLFLLRIFGGGSRD